MNILVHTWHDHAQYKLRIPHARYELRGQISWALYIYGKGIELCKTDNVVGTNGDGVKLSQHFIYLLFFTDIDKKDYLRKMLLICFLMKARRPRNLPYIRCNTVFRKSLSLGSSLSNNSNSCNKQHMNTSQNAGNLQCIQEFRNCRFVGFQV